MILQLMHNDGTGDKEGHVVTDVAPFNASLWPRILPDAPEVMQIDEMAPLRATNFSGICCSITTIGISRVNAMNWLCSQRVVPSKSMSQTRWSRNNIREERGSGRTFCGSHEMFTRPQRTFSNLCEMGRVNVTC